MKAVDFLKEYPYLPVTLKRGEGKEIYGRPSNAELNRWLQNKSVVINGKSPQPLDEIEYPITELVFFPKSEHRVTIVKEIK